MKEKETKKTADKHSPKTTRTKAKKNPMGTAFNLDEIAFTDVKMQEYTAKPKRRTPVREKKNLSDTGKDIKKQAARGKAEKLVAPEKKQRGIKSEFQRREKTLIIDAEQIKKLRKNKQQQNIVAEKAEKTEKQTLTRGNKRKKATKIIFLGGVGEIGKNMTAIEYGNDIIIVDAGLTFPNGEDMPGVDSVVPDITYLAQNKHKIRGVLLTHGHEDHIGGIPFLMKELEEGTPIYGTKLTLMLTDNKLQEQRILSTVQKVVKAGDRIKLGVFEVEFINDGQLTLF